MDIVKEKIAQTGQILENLDIDMWLVFVRETEIQNDPVMPLVVGHQATWQSFFMFSRDGSARALVGHLDQEDYIRSGNFTEVLTYTEGPREGFREILRNLDPRKIAINYSTNDPSADGLTYGMYLLLLDYLEGTPFADRLISAEEVCRRVRGRKTPSEIDNLSAAGRLALDAWDRAVKEIEVGMSEVEIAEILDGHIRKLGSLNSFPTIVNAGDKTRPGHGSPTDARVEPGDLLHVDFGAMVGEYCSDLQRLLYFRRPDEPNPPHVLIDAFNLVRDIIEEAANRARPGVKGHEIDAFARDSLRHNGYEEYQHALGHQLGRGVHDGGAAIAPRWDRYGRTPTIPLEADNVFTLELEIILPDIGCVGLEEDVRITENGARFLCPPQKELLVK